MECVFCKIIKKEIPSQIFFEDDKIIVLSDIAPKAEAHFLIIPKIHIESLNHLEEKDNDLISRLIFAGKNISKKIILAKNGYKLIFNVGKEGGQVIGHLHLHFLAGKMRQWP